MSDSKIDDYLAAARRTQPGFGPTQDFADPALGRTVQSPDGIPVTAEGLPGQRFMVGQLPHPETAVASGLPPVTIPGYLLLTDDEAGDDPQGPTLEERASLKERERLGFPTTSFTGEVMSHADATKSLTDLTDPANRRGVGSETDNTPKGAEAGDTRTDPGTRGDVQSTGTPQGPNPAVATSTESKTTV